MVIQDRVPLVLVKNGKPCRTDLPVEKLDDVVRNELFLKWCEPWDRVI